MPPPRPSLYCLITLTLQDQRPSEESVNQTKSCEPVKHTACVDVGDIAADELIGNEIKDPQYVPNVDDIQNGDDTIVTSNSKHMPTHVTEKKYIVCESSLGSVFCKLTCSQCTANVDGTCISKRHVGSDLFVNLLVKMDITC